MHLTITPKKFLKIDIKYSIFKGIFKLRKGKKRSNQVRGRHTITYLRKRNLFIISLRRETIIQGITDRFCQG